MGIIADILQRHGDAYLDGAGTAAPVAQHLAVRRITACRTGRLGGHAEYCPGCAELVEFIPHSCRDRLCPACRGPEAHAWLQARQAEVLPVRYFHVIVTVRIRACDEGPQVVLKYLTRYVRSGPLHESQILQAEDAELAFRYLDHRSGTVQTWRGTPAAFVERYLQHAMPHRFHRIRHYGFYAPGRRRDLHALQVALIARYAPRALAPEPACESAQIPRPCPYCGSTRPRLRVRLRPSQLAGIVAVTWRAPPAQTS